MKGTKRKGVLVFGADDEGIVVHKKKTEGNEFG